MRVKLNGITYIASGSIGGLVLETTHWIMAHQWWFIIKMALVIGLVLNGLLVAKPNTEKLRKMVPRIIHGEPLLTEVQEVKKKMVIFHIYEITMLLVVYLLTVFRFQIYMTSLLLKSSRVLTAP